jgi:hypothetical protein
VFFSALLILNVLDVLKTVATDFHAKIQMESKQPASKINV